MDIEGWRQKIDDVDRQLVRLINERAQCAQAIGRLKRDSAMPIYEPDREKIIFQNIARVNAGPLSDVQLPQLSRFCLIFRFGSHFFTLNLPHHIHQTLIDLAQLHV